MRKLACGRFSKIGALLCAILDEGLFLWALKLQSRADCACALALKFPARRKKRAKLRADSFLKYGVFALKNLLFYFCLKKQREVVRQPYSIDVFGKYREFFDFNRL